MLFKLQFFTFQNTKLKFYKTVQQFVVFFICSDNKKIKIFLYVAACRLLPEKYIVCDQENTDSSSLNSPTRFS